jgi:O-antigen/teichoic acid export membrane protein
VDFAETKKVLRVSLPFFIAIAAVYIGAYVDVVLLRELVPDGSEEVGWYGSAREISRLSAMMMPVLTGVLVPMMSRAMHSDENEFYRLVRRGMEGVCVVSIPLTLLLALSAKFAIGFVLGPAFLPAHYSLEWLAPTFVLAYVNSLLWLALMIMKRSWTITVVSVIGTALLPIFILVAAPLTKGTGDGKMGMGVAMALSAREWILAVIYIAIVGMRALDDRAMGAIAKSLGICGAVVAAHLALASLGDLRLLVDAALYGVLAFALRVIRIGDVINLLRLIKNRRQIQAEVTQPASPAA